MSKVIQLNCYTPREYVSAIVSAINSALLSPIEACWHIGFLKKIVHENTVHIVVYIILSTFALPQYSKSTHPFDAFIRGIITGYCVVSPVALIRNSSLTKTSRQLNWAKTLSFYVFQLLGNISIMGLRVSLKLLQFGLTTVMVQHEINKAVAMHRLWANPSSNTSIVLKIYTIFIAVFVITLQLT